MELLFNSRHKYISTISAIIFSLIMFSSCNAFMLGFTQLDANGVYKLITSDKKNFGDKRLKYNMYMYSKSEFRDFINEQGKPDFIYEYQTVKGGYDMVVLYYVNIDSAFEFKELVKTDARKINYEEREEWKKLQLTKSVK